MNNFCPRCGSNDEAIQRLDIEGTVAKWCHDPWHGTAPPQVSEQDEHWKETASKGARDRLERAMRARERAYEDMEIRKLRAEIRAAQREEGL